MPIHREANDGDTDTTSLARRSLSSVREPIDPRISPSDRAPDAVLDEGYIRQLHEHQQHAYESHEANDDKNNKGRIQLEESESNQDETTYVSHSEPSTRLAYGRTWLPFFLIGYSLPFPSSTRWSSRMAIHGTPTHSRTPGSGR